MRAEALASISSTHCMHACTVFMLHEDEDESDDFMIMILDHLVVVVVVDYVHVTPVFISLLSLAVLEFIRRMFSNAIHHQQNNNV